MKRSIKEISHLLAGDLFGDAKAVVKGVANIEDAVSGDITFAFDEKAVDKFELSAASFVLVPKNLKKFPKKSHIRVSDIKLAMAKLLTLFEQKKVHKTGIHKSAIVSKSANISKSACIMANVVIWDNAAIGDNSVIFNGVSIGNNVKIGKRSVIHPNVVLYDDIFIGNDVIIHAGCIIGVDGFGYAPVNGDHIKIPQLGNVIIEDNVEIMANTCISRATLGSTLIMKGTKIDNITHIAHNCKVGKNCAITALVAIAGSTELGDHVSVGGTAAFADHVKVGPNSVVMARSGVTKDFPSNSVISGFPAQDHKKEMEQQATIRRLPKLFEKVSEIEKKLTPSSLPDRSGHLSS